MQPSAHGFGRQSWTRIPNIEFLVLLQVRIFMRYLYAFECLFQSSEIVRRRQSTAGAMLLPFMLNQVPAGHELQHMVRDICGHRAGGHA